MINTAFSQVLILPAPQSAAKQDIPELNATIEAQFTHAFNQANFDVIDVDQLNLPNCLIENCSLITQQRVLEIARQSKLNVHVAIFYRFSILQHRENGLVVWHLALDGKIVDLQSGNQQDAFEVQRSVKPPTQGCIADCYSQWLKQHATLLAQELGTILSEKLVFIPQNYVYQLTLNGFSPQETQQIAQAISTYTGYLNDELVSETTLKQDILQLTVNRKITYRSTLSAAQLQNLLQHTLQKYHLAASLNFDSEKHVFSVNRLTLPYLNWYIAGGVLLFSLIIFSLYFIGRYLWQAKHQRVLNHFHQQHNMQLWLDYVSRLKQNWLKKQWRQQKDSYISQLAKAKTHCQLAQQSIALKQYTQAQIQIESALKCDQHHPQALILRHTLASYQRGDELLLQAQTNILDNKVTAQIQLQEALYLNPTLTEQCKIIAQAYEIDLNFDALAASSVADEPLPQATTLTDVAQPKKSPVLLVSITCAALVIILIGFKSALFKSLSLPTLPAQTVDDSLLTKMPEHGPLDELNEKKQHETLAWQQASALDNEQSYRFYLNRWPEGQHALLAHNALQDELSDQTAWQLALSKQNIEAFQAYLSHQPQGKYRSLAKQKIGELNDLIQQQNSLNELIHLADQYYFEQQDFPEARYYYQQSAERGDAYAQFQLAQMYYQGQGVELNFTEAAVWFKQAAKQGYARAQLTLGFMYSKGQGLTQNYQLAADWYKQAAQQGLSNAQYNLAYLYAQGLGQIKNYQYAAHWYALAAEQGDADAQNDLAKLYERGLGVPLDINKAKILYRQAARQGHQVAQINLNLLH